MIEAGRFDEAAAVLERGLSIIDYDPEAWNYLGVAHWNRGRFREARECYEKALALKPEDLYIQQNFDLFREADDKRNRKSRRRK